jgi:hypothetical protein
MSAKEPNRGEGGRLDDDFLQSADRGAGAPGILYKPNFVLACLFHGNALMTDPKNVLCGGTAGRDGC